MSVKIKIGNKEVELPIEVKEDVYHPTELSLAVHIAEYALREKKIPSIADVQEDVEKSGFLLTKECARIYNLVLMLLSKILFSQK